MGRVIVRILHVEPASAAGPLERFLADARRANGERHALGFREAGADDVALVGGPPDDTPFGRRLEGLIEDAAGGSGEAGRTGDGGSRRMGGGGSRRMGGGAGGSRRMGGGGIVVLGAGALPLATLADRRAFVAAAGRHDRTALTNNRYSSDVIAVARAGELPPIDDLAADNALPRWLAERAGWRVSDLRTRWRLGMDLDSPLDVELVRPGTLPADLGDRVRARCDAIGRVMSDARAELLVAGRTSAGTLRWLERWASSRVRALVEERGLRASDRAALGDETLGDETLGDETRGPESLRDEGRSSRLRPPRPPRSALGMLVDHEGPERLGKIIAELADAALIDTRVLLASRCGADEASWPTAEDRFASDLLLADRIVDPWLRSLTEAAMTAPVPILLGGHSLVGPGVRLIGPRAARASHAGP